MILLCSISCIDLNNNSVDGDVTSVAVLAAYPSGNYDNDFLPEYLIKETRDMKKGFRKSLLLLVFRLFVFLLLLLLLFSGFGF
jgi:hypothetical protein